MRHLISILSFMLIVQHLTAADWQLVRIPAPQDETTILPDSFELYHRAGDFWIGRVSKNISLPPGSFIYERFDPEAGEIFRLLLASPEESEKLKSNVHFLYEDQMEVIFQATPDQLRALPKIRGQWIRIGQSPRPTGYSGVEIPERDDFHPIIEDLVNQVSQTQYTEYLQTLEDFNTRNTFTTGYDNSAVWVYDRFTEFGLDASYDDFTIQTAVKQNVIGELTGLVHPDSIVFITAHLDATANNQWSPEPVAPGADDNGSGTACFLECARILSQYNFEKTIRFVAFGGEEQGLWGSWDYVGNLLNAGTEVVGSFNYDMIAYSGNDPLPPDLILYADNNPLSQAMADKVAEAITTFIPTSLEPVIYINPSMTASDHSPFWDAGWPAILGIEAEPWGPEFNPFYHSVNDRVVNCDLYYATNCTRAALAAVADYAIPIEESGPYLAVYDQQMNEIFGNTNGIPEPGEAVSLQITLINAGSYPATGISADMTTDNPYLTITQNSSTYPDLDIQQTGVCLQPYTLQISTSCPQETWVTVELHIIADGGYQRDVPIGFLVGDMRFDPSGPDLYGYYAYDMHDGAFAPDYNWIEIAPMAGGPGTELELLNYDAETIPIPFDFQFYGTTYNQVTVCSHGWLSFGETTIFIPVNRAIPDSLAPPDGFVAVFWDELIPESGGQICYYHDATNNQFVVEWYQIPHVQNPDSVETFQIILLDPSHYPTTTGDGEIIVNYQSLSEAIDGCTFGIEAPSGTYGIQYLYNGLYHTQAMPIEDFTSIKYTTEAEITALEPTKPEMNYPNNYYLVRCYPNPFNPTTVLSFELSVSSRINLSVYNISGRLVDELVNGWREAGVHEVTFDGSDLASCMYFYRITAEGLERGGKYQATGKMLLLK